MRSIHCKPTILLHYSISKASIVSVTIWYPSIIAPNVTSSFMYVNTIEFAIRSSMPLDAQNIHKPRQCYFCYNAIKNHLDLCLLFLDFFSVLLVQVFQRQAARSGSSLVSSVFPVDRPFRSHPNQRRQTGPHS